jgi:ubiquinone/menaquinone biosynthesis C-methylase UbiE
MTSTALRYIPALSFQWLTPVYDPLLRWGMREEAFKRELVKRADLHPGTNVLDLGCGTGTLTIMLKRAAPAASVTGLDPDPRILSIAREKAARTGTRIQWEQGTACELPYPDHSFDVVVSSLVVHHLPTAGKLLAFREVHRILRPGGKFHIADFGPSYGALTRLQAAIGRHLEHADDNFGGRIPAFLERAGFAGASAAAYMNTVFGPIWFYAARAAQGA